MSHANQPPNWASWSLLTNGYKLSAFLSFADLLSHDRAYLTAEEAWETVRKAVTK